MVLVSAVLPLGACGYDIHTPALSGRASMNMPRAGEATDTCVQAGVDVACLPGGPEAMLPHFRPSPDSARRAAHG